jgi:tetratricopeptide (TPR) repeat protein
MRLNRRGVVASFFRRELAIIGLLCAPCFAADSSLRDDGLAAFREGRYSAALAKLQQAASSSPEDVTVQVFVGLTKAAQNNCEAALPVLSKYVETSDSSLARLDGLAAAKCEESSGNTLKALQILEKLQTRFPKDADIIYTVAKFHMKAFNDATLAMFERTPSSYRVHQLSAEIFEVQGRYEEAEEEYRKAITLNPKATDLHYRLGRAILMRSHGAEALEKARGEFLAEAKVSPEDAATEFQLGQIAQVEGQAGQAAAYFENALKFSPDFAEGLVALGKLQQQAKRYDQAIPLLRRAVSLQPANEAAHYALMLAYRDSGQSDKAREEKAELDRLQKPPEGEFTDFLKKLGGQAPEPQ